MTSRHAPSISLFLRLEQASNAASIKFCHLAKRPNQASARTCQKFMDYEIVLPILEDLGGYREMLYVHPSSCENHRDALEKMASYFKREFQYDHLQYEATEHSEDCFGILLLEQAMDLVKDIDHFPNRVVGGGCFWKKVADESKDRASIEEYCLDWIWLHPFARHRGRLRKEWSGLKRKFGDFDLTHPLSSSMKNFLAKGAGAGRQREPAA